MKLSVVKKLNLLYTLYISKVTTMAPKKVPQVEKDVEMESVPEDAVQAAPAPRFECASL